MTIAGPRPGCSPGRADPYRFDLAAGNACRMSLPETGAESSQSSVSRICASLRRDRCRRGGPVHRHPPLTANRRRSPKGITMPPGAPARMPRLAPRRRWPRTWGVHTTRQAALVPGRPRSFSVRYPPSQRPDGPTRRAERRDWAAEGATSWGPTGFGGAARCARLQVAGLAVQCARLCVQKRPVPWSSRSNHVGGLFAARCC